MTELQKELARRWIREHPESEQYRGVCAIPPEQRHESMRNLPYVLR